MSLTDEQGFALMRRWAPSAGEITVYDDPATHRRIVRLEGITEKERNRVAVGLSLRSPLVRWQVEAASPRKDQT